ncbi:MAG: hypothetical protein KC518_14385 [Candidatus Cloacimonetes bacterium]|nr:hypothetical protein [Candidatus Cloacimonadota bacterium]
MNTRLPARLPLLALCLFLLAARAVWGAQDTADSGGNPHGDLKGMACTACHSTQAWTPLATTLNFNHSKQGGWPLQGVHGTLRCTQCHALQFAEVESSCAGCHTDVHSGSAGTDCQRCHTPESWRDPGGFRRAHEGSAFPLEGPHHSLSCTACHTGQNFSESPLACAGCHNQEYLATRDPGHSSLGLSVDCQQCHNPAANGWRADFSHPAEFPLEGAHRGPACVACHLPEQPLSALERQCAGCHVAPGAEGDPDHRSSAFTENCATCHTIQAWAPAQFDHSASAFPLTGRHQQAECASCHQQDGGSRFSGLDTACASCHQQDAEDAADPDHSSSALAGDCAICHETSDWNPARFDHALSAFALTGAHRDAECTACHVQAGQSLFTGLDDQCAACHQADADATTDPDHAGAALSGDCALCHTTEAFSPAEFEHQLSRFALTGAHLETDCLDCHRLDASPRFTDMDTQCASCHQQDADDTSDPDHASGPLAGDCALCHTTTAFSPAEFDHGLSAFPLTGAHL